MSTVNLILLCNSHSIKRGRDYTVTEQATIQEHFLRYLGIGKVHILAHDLGDTVALEMLARYYMAIPMQLCSFLIISFSNVCTLLLGDFLNYQQIIINYWTRLSKICETLSNHDIL